MIHNPPQIIVLASGNGTTFETIVTAINEGRISGVVRMLICNRPGAGVIERAKRMGIENTVTANSGDQMSQEIGAVLDSINPDLIVLAGFMRILSNHIIEKYGRRMINTHPALLPCFGGKGFYGDRVHRAVIESGAKVSGCTVHFVTTGVDEGPIIAQSTVPVLDSDDVKTLSERVQKAEKLLLVETIQKLLTSPYRIEGKRVLF